MAAYASNRNYRNRTVFDTENAEDLFDRSALVESVKDELEGVILATYTLKLNDIQREMPSLFSRSSTIPVLLLHGNQGLDGERSQIRKRRDEYEWKEFRTDDTTEIQKCTLPESCTVSEVAPYAKCTEHARGVHHPKYMLLFLKNPKRVIFVVSTSNLTTQLSVDVSWLQTFEAAKITKATEFGAVLDDLLQKQGESIETNAHQQSEKRKTTSYEAKQLMTPKGWLATILGITSMDSEYDFSTATTRLVTSVPGVWKEGDPESNKYGHRRVGAIIGSRETRVIVQPTSIGAKITDTYHRELAGSYGVQPDIMWPSLPFVLEARKRNSRQRHSNLITRGCPVVCDASNFVAMNHDTHSAFFEYTPRDHLRHLLPHNKFVYGLSEDRIEWLLMTSMCLSQGACGFIDPDDRFRIRNFEVGVLFPHCSPDLIQCLPFDPRPRRRLVVDDTFTFVPYLDLTLKDPCDGLIKNATFAQIQHRFPDLASTYFTDAAINDILQCLTPDDDTDHPPPPLSCGSPPRIRRRRLSLLPDLYAAHDHIHALAHDDGASSRHTSFSSYDYCYSS